MAGGLLAAAMAEAQRRGSPRATALARQAFDRGAGTRARGARGGRGAIRRSLRVLEDQGFEPRVEADAVTLANCPFHALAREHTELVCGMNLRLLGRASSRVPALQDPLAADLRPSPGMCCVRLGHSPR